jgi:hypothetical protein
LTSGKGIQILPYADYQVVIRNSEDELQMAINKINKIGKIYDMKISSSKTKTIELCVNTYKVSKYKLKVTL